VRLLELTREYYPSVGGLEKFVHDRTLIYQQLGIQHSVITTDFSTEKISAEEHRYPVTVLRQFTPYNIVPSLHRYLTDEYDIVSLNLIGRFYSDYAAHHYRRKRQSIIVTPYFAFHTSRFSMLKRLMETIIFPRILERMDGLVVFTEYERQFWQEQFNVPIEKIFVIPPYISSLPEPRLENPVSKPYILSIGRAGANKKTDLLLESFLHWNQCDIELKITIRPEDISQKLRRLVLDDTRIVLLGNVGDHEKHRLLQHCRALIFATSWESFGYVAFEAAQYAKPLLCSALPVLKELHDPGGVIFFENTAAGLHQALEAFNSLTEPERAAMGRLNEINAGRYSFERSVSQYQNLFTAIR
jgi:glycosyltransferase involved in cell wall biosynthesis